MKVLNKLLCIFAFFISAGSQAGLIGDTVLLEYRTERFLLGSTSVEVSPQIERRSWNYWLFDFSDNGLMMSSDSNSGYTGGVHFLFSDLDFGPGEILSNVLATGIEQSRVSFTDDSIKLDFGWLGFTYTQKIFLTFETTTVPVPEPGTLGLLFISLVSLAVLRRRQAA